MTALTKSVTASPLFKKLMARYNAQNELLAAAKFSLSVHRAQGLFDRSEQMAAEKLAAAIKAVEGWAND